MSAADLEKRMSLFGMEMTWRNGLISILDHMHEHLGQSIAYARMDGVVPPWTLEQEAAEKAKKPDRRISSPVGRASRRADSLA